MPSHDLLTHLFISVFFFAFLTSSIFSLILGQGAKWGLQAFLDDLHVTCHLTLDLSLFEPLLAKGLYLHCLSCPQANASISFSPLHLECSLLWPLVFWFPWAFQSLSFTQIPSWWFHCSPECPSCSIYRSNNALLEVVSSEGVVLKLLTLKMFKLCTWSWLPFWLGIETLSKTLFIGYHCSPSKFLDLLFILFMLLVL